MMMDCAYPKLVFEYIAPTLYKYRVEMSLPDGKVFVLNIKDCEKPLSTKEQETLAIRAYHEANGMAMPMTRTPGCAASSGKPAPRNGPRR